MKHKILYITVLLFLLFIIFFSLFYNFLLWTSSTDNSIKTPINNKKEVKDSEIKKDDNLDKEENDSKDNEEEQVNTQDNNSSQKPTINYYCPDDLVLEYNKCVATVDANYTCPLNTIDYSSDGLPRDTYCVNLNDGYETSSDSCPENYGIMAVISIGKPTVYKCLVLYNKSYTCNDGYELNGDKCIKKMDAEIR